MSGRLVTVTGGDKGIGRAVVQRFVAAGDRVVVVGRDRAAVAAAAGAGGSGEVCDVTDEAAVVALFERIGVVDVLVNNAGVSTSARLHATTLADWQHQLDVNATGVTANAVCPTFVRTDMTRRSLQRIAAATGRTEAESESALVGTLALGRLLEPDEVAFAVAFLAAPDAAAINGQTLVLDGGAV